MVIDKREILILIPLIFILISLYIGRIYILIEIQTSTFYHGV